MDIHFVLYHLEDWIVTVYQKTITCGMFQFSWMDNSELCW